MKIEILSSPDYSSHRSGLAWIDNSGDNFASKIPDNQINNLLSQLSAETINKRQIDTGYPSGTLAVYQLTVIAFAHLEALSDVKTEDIDKAKIHAKFALRTLHDLTCTIHFKPLLIFLKHRHPNIAYFFGKQLDQLLGQSSLLSLAQQEKVLAVISAISHWPALQEKRNTLALLQRTELLKQSHAFRHIEQHLEQLPTDKASDSENNLDIAAIRKIDSNFAMDSFEEVSVTKRLSTYVVLIATILLATYLPGTIPVAGVILVIATPILALFFTNKLINNIKEWRITLTNKVAKRKAEVQKRLLVRQQSTKQMIQFIKDAVKRLADADSVITISQLADYFFQFCEENGVQEKCVTSFVEEMFDNTDIKSQRPKLFAAFLSCITPTGTKHSLSSEAQTIWQLLFARVILSIDISNDSAEMLPKILRKVSKEALLRFLSIEGASHESTDEIQQALALVLQHCEITAKDSRNLITQKVNRSAQLSQNFEVNDEASEISPQMALDSIANHWYELTSQLLTSTEPAMLSITTATVAYLNTVSELASDNQASSEEEDVSAQQLTLPNRGLLQHLLDQQHEYGPKEVLQKTLESDPALKLVATSSDQAFVLSLDTIVKATDANASMDLIAMMKTRPLKASLLDTDRLGERTQWTVALINRLATANSVATYRIASAYLAAGLPSEEQLEAIANALLCCHHFLADNAKTQAYMDMLQVLVHRYDFYLHTESLELAHRVSMPDADTATEDKQASRESSLALAILNLARHLVTEKTASDGTTSEPLEIIGCLLPKYSKTVSSVASEAWENNYKALNAAIIKDYRGFKSAEKRIAKIYNEHLAPSNLFLEALPKLSAAQITKPYTGMWSRSERQAIVDSNTDKIGQHYSNMN